MDPNEVFYGEALGRSAGGPSTGESFQGFPIGYTTGCVWLDGVHAYCENPDCPEVNQKDDAGEHLPVGWTVQQADRYADLVAEIAKERNK